MTAPVLEAATAASATETASKPKPDTASDTPRDLRMIYLIGAPGSGKSTLMAALTEHLKRTAVSASMQLITAGPDQHIAHDALMFLDGDLAGAEIGKQREQFGGTDALPASIIEKAIPWVQRRPYDLLFAEGARLANRRFIDAAREAGYHVHLCLLDHPDVDAWRSVRDEKLGKSQSPSWIAGRVTASRNLAKFYMDRAGEGVSVYVGHPSVLITELEHLLG